MNERYDFVIVGCGVVGCMLARFLSRYQASILLIEKEADVGMGASSANSAIVHAGYDPLPGTLKAKMNVRANAMWDNLAGELNFPFERRGDYVVAIGPGRTARSGQADGAGPPERRAGHALHLRGRNAPARAEINPQVSGALWAPTGGICDPFAVTVAAAENAVQNGVHGACSIPPSKILSWARQRSLASKPTAAIFGCRWAVNAAGLYSDEVMHRAGVRPEFSITPRRGEYCVLDRAEIHDQQRALPSPQQGRQGHPGHHHPARQHASSAPMPMPSTDKEDRAVTAARAIEELCSGAHKLVPWLQYALHHRHLCRAARDRQCPLCRRRASITTAILSSKFPGRCADWSTWAASNRRA